MTAPTAALAGASSASVSLWLRVNGGALGADTTLLGTIYHADSLSILFQGYYAPALNNLVYAAATSSGGGAGHADMAVTLQPGVTYHLAASISSGVLTYYVNGSVALAFSMPGTLGLPSHPPVAYGIGLAQFGYNGGTLDATIDDVAAWAGYALTAADVLALRDRSASPGAIAASNRAFHFPFSGTPGSAASAHDPALADSGPHSLAVASLVGAPAYAAPLIYTPPARVLSAAIAPSGQGVAVLLSDLSGNLIDAATLALPPTASLGGSPLALQSPAWGMGGVPARASAGPYLPWIYYPLAAPIPPSSANVTMAFPEGWATSALGEVAGAANFPVAPSSGSFLAPFVANPKSMKVGYNVNIQSYYYPVRTHANAFKGAGRINAPAGPDGLPTSMGGASTLNSLVISSGTNGYDGNGYCCFPPGHCTLLWAGTSLLELAGGNGSTAVTLVSRAMDPAGLNNVAVYDLQVSQGSTRYSVAINSIWHGADIRNPRLFDSSVADPHNPPAFHPSFLRMSAGADTYRSMDALYTNSSGMANFADFALPGDYSMQGMATWTAVASIGPAPPDAGYGTRVPVLITTAAPHGLSDGQCYGLTLASNCGPHGNGSFDLVGGGAVNLLNGSFPARVLSPTTLGGAAFSSSYTGPLAATYSGASLGASPHIYITTRAGWAPSDFLDFCAAQGANPWINLPMGATDDCATQFGALAAAKVPPGKFVYLEYCNEPWNYAPGFQSYNYLSTKAALAGLQEMQWYTLRAGQVRDAFVAGWAAAGRAAADVRLVLNCQAVSPGMTSQVASYAAAHSIAFHAIAIAPYYSNSAALIVTGVQERGLAAAYDAMSDEQLMDVGELMMEYGGQQLYGPAHLGALAAAGLPGVKLVCYEGGPDFGLPATNDDGTAAKETTIGARSRRWARHPRQRGILLRYLQHLQDGGVELFNDYTCNYIMSGFYSAENWSAYFNWDMRAGTGDGSDGQFDNRTNYEDQAHLVSVVGGAINAWNALAAPPPPPPPAPPAPHPPGPPAATVTVSPSMRYLPRATASRGASPSFAAR